MTLKEALEEVKKNIDTETDVSVNVNGLHIEVSGYSHLAQTCWLTFAMKDLGKRIGKDYLGDEYSSNGKLRVFSRPENVENYIVWFLNYKDKARM